MKAQLGSRCASTLAVVILVAAMLFAAQPVVPTPTDRLAMREERLELAMEFRGRMAQQRLLERSGEAQAEPIEYGPNGPTPGWVGQRRFGIGNDWEPEIAADPSGDYVYWLTTRFGQKWSGCSACSNPSIVMRISSDNGQTWGQAVYLHQGGDTWQYDPQVEVDQNGTVFVAWLANKWRTRFKYSTDHGQTWSTPVDVKVPLAWSDHGWLTVSPDGQDVYIGFNKANSYVAASHDGGNTWNAPVQTNPPNEDRYYYHYNGAVLPDDSVVIAATALPRSPYAQGPVRYYALRSTDGGATWQQIHIDTVKEQPHCYSYRCPRDHYAGMSTVAADLDGDLIFAYAGAKVARKGQVIFVRTSSDGGQTWSARQELSPNFAANGKRRVIASFVLAASGGNDDFRIMWLDNRRGRWRWNAWHRSSTDGGTTWTPAQRISDAETGAGYKHKGGFDADYGDYGGITVNSDGKTMATWGEAFSYWGPGGTWLNAES